MRHKLDITPIPEKVLYINEPWMIDGSIDCNTSSNIYARNTRATNSYDPNGKGQDGINIYATNEEAQAGINQLDNQPDNVRIYLPMDLNKVAILRRLDVIVNRYGEANEMNEMNFSLDVSQLIYQIEVYDQVWYARHGDGDGKHGLSSKHSDIDGKHGQSSKHSAEAVALVKEFITKLEAIPDGCAECFPFELIDELKEEYLG